MRQMTYTVELTEEYRISGQKNDIELTPEKGAGFLKLSLTPMRHHQDRTCNTWDEVIERMVVSMNIEDEDDREFADHYPEILRGEYAGWELRTVTIYESSLSFWYDKPETSGVGILSLKDITGRSFDLTVTAPVSFFGIMPTYRIEISNEKISVEENVGYIRRNVEFLQHVKDPSVYSSKYILEITEYDGI